MFRLNKSFVHAKQTRKKSKLKKAKPKKNEQKKKRLNSKGPTNGRSAELGDMFIVYVLIKFEQRRLFI